jgi:AbrB family looped-hinge helix DNA binding protein
MPTKFKVKLTRIGNSLRMTIPKPAVDGLGWNEGDALNLTVTDHEVAIRKATGKD